MAAKGKVTRWYKYGDRDIPAYRDEGGFMLVMDDGTERPVTDLRRWLDEASDITEAEFNELKARHAASHAKSAG
jgi:hypothetical protein